MLVWRFIYHGNNKVFNMKKRTNFEIRTWTPEEDKILFYNKHLPHKEISKLLGRSVNCIRGRLARTRWVRVVEEQVWVEKEDHYELEVTSKKLGKHKILVSKDKIDKVNNIRWYLYQNKSGIIYGKHEGSKSKFRFTVHELILGQKYADHINGNGLDNRNENLRPATKQQNAWNSRKVENCGSKYKGVYKVRDDKWTVQVNGKHVGIFKTELEAAKAYDKKALEIYGEFARLNFQLDTSEEVLYT